jgi:hypothetical protein
MQPLVEECFTLNMHSALRMRCWPSASATRRSLVALQGDSGRTPLHVAAASGSSALAEAELRLRAADVNARDKVRTRDLMERPVDQTQVPHCQRCGMQRSCSLVPHTNLEGRYVARRLWGQHLHERALRSAVMQLPALGVLVVPGWLQASLILGRTSGTGSLQRGRTSTTLAQHRHAHVRDVRPAQHALCNYGMQAAGWAPLHVAAQCCQQEIAELLLSRGADPNLADKVRAHSNRTDCHAGGPRTLGESTGMQRSCDCNANSWQRGIILPPCPPPHCPQP